MDEAMHAEVTNGHMIPHRPECKPAITKRFFVFEIKNYLAVSLELNPVAVGDDGYFHLLVRRVHELVLA